MAQAAIERQRRREERSARRIPFPSFFLSLTVTEVHLHHGDIANKPAMSLTNRFTVTPTA